MMVCRHKYNLLMFDLELNLSDPLARVANEEVNSIYHLISNMTVLIMQLMDGVSI